MKKVIIYGINHQAQQLKALLEVEAETQVCGFTVDKAYKKSDMLLGLPVCEFEKVETLYPPAEFEIVLSFGYKNMIKNRAEKYKACKNKGYALYTYISKHALVYTEDVGEGSIIYPGCFIAPFTKIGKGCFLENSCSVAHHTVVGDFVFCGPGANICGDVTVSEYCFLGAGSVVAGPIHLGRRTLVAAGAVCLKDTPEGTVCFPSKSVYVNDREPEEWI